MDCLDWFWTNLVSPELWPIKAPFKCQRVCLGDIISDQIVLQVVYMQPSSTWIRQAARESFPKEVSGKKYKSWHHFWFWKKHPICCPFSVAQVPVTHSHCPMIDLTNLPIVKDSSANPFTFYNPSYVQTLCGKYFNAFFKKSNKVCNFGISFFLPTATNIIIFTFINSFQEFCSKGPNCACGHWP